MTEVKGGYSNGDLVNVFSKKERYLGTGFINDFSKIRIRLISRNANDRFDDEFWKRRVRYAIDYRKTVMPGGFPLLPADIRGGGLLSGADG